LSKSFPGRNEGPRPSIPALVWGGDGKRAERKGGKPLRNVLAEVQWKEGPRGAAGDYHRVFDKGTERKSQQQIG